MPTVWSPGYRASFDPSDITTALWLDAADASTITESGGVVSQWDNKGLAGGSFTVPFAKTGPTTGFETINGVNAIFFNQNVLEIVQSLGTNSGAEMFYVYKVPTDTVYRWFYQFGTTDQGYIAGGSGTTIISRNYLINDDPSDTNINGLNAGWVNGVTSRINVYNDLGTDPVMVSVPNLDITGWANFTISDSNTFGTTDGSLGEVIVTEDALTLEDRQKTEGYLAWKWGLEGSLPVGHPYKNAAP
jgi:hypothetical protein